MKISSTTKLIENNSEVEQSLSSSHEYHPNESSKVGKLPPSLSIAQIKKPFYGIKTNVISEYSTCKKFDINSKRESVNNMQSKTTKNTHRDLFWTPSALTRDYKPKKQINIMHPKKKGLIISTSNSNKNLEGVKKFSRNIYNPDFKSEIRIKLPNSNKGSQSRNVVKYLSGTNSANLSKSNSIKRFQPIWYTLQGKKVKKPARVISNDRN